MNRDVVSEYYNSGVEKDRLVHGHSRLEGIRSKEIISRYLAPSGMKILDLGGGAGFYSFWLQSLGHHVTLVDLSPGNIELVDKFSKEHNISLDKAEVGNATELHFADEDFDLVLLMGPLYHLTEKNTRVKALSEARRVLKTGGTMIAAVISRYASMIDGFHRDLISDPQFVDILRKDLKEGVHINQTTNFEYFTTSFFHTPENIIDEIRESKLEFEKLVAVEGLGWLIDFSKTNNNPGYFENVMEFIRSIESNMDIVAASPHMLAIARKSIYP